MTASENSAVGPADGKTLTTSTRDRAAPDLEMRTGHRCRMTDPQAPAVPKNDPTSVRGSFEQGLQRRMFHYGVRGGIVEHLLKRIVHPQGFPDCFNMCAECIPTNPQAVTWCG